MPSAVVLIFTRVRVSPEIHLGGLGLIAEADAATGAILGIPPDSLVGDRQPVPAIRALELRKVYLEYKWASGAFRVGQTVRNITTSPVNIRQSPGYLGKLPSDVINVIRPGDTLEIVAGPNPGDKLTWWRIRYNGTEGWVAEATASGVQILGK